jgi:hypothetical protein
MEAYMCLKFFKINFLLMLVLLYGFSQGAVYYKVIHEGANTNGTLKIANSYSEISNNSSCNTATCVTLPINGSKLVEYLMACLTQLRPANGGSFSKVTSGGYKLTLGSPVNSIVSLEFYEDGTGTNIKLTIKTSNSSKDKVGILRLIPNANAKEQMKMDYFVGILVSSLLQNTVSPLYICFEKDTNGMITDLFAIHSTTANNPEQCPNP